MMPPALPLRSRGTAFIISRLLGEAKTPKPAPHSTSRHMMSALDGFGGSSAVRTRPAVMLVRPMAPNSAGVMAVGQAAGDRRDGGQRQRPGGQQDTGARWRPGPARCGRRRAG